MPDLKSIGDMTADDYNAAFAENGWTEAGGNIQSLMFATALQHFMNQQPVFRKMQEVPGLVVRDYGCAEGDGTALWQVYFQHANVIGVDISATGLERARKRYPTIAFELGDIRDPKESNLIVSTHVIEHMTDPVSVIRNLQRKCQWLVIGVPPTGGGTQDKTHPDAVPFDVWFHKTAPIGMAEYTTDRLDPFTTKERGKKWTIREWTRAILYRGEMF